MYIIGIAVVLASCAPKPKPCFDPPIERTDDPNAFPVEHGHSWDALSK